MTKKPIAVITEDILATVNWLREHYKVNQVNFAQRIARSDDEVYVLITNKEQAYGREFSGVIISPFYESLEEVVKSRIR